jgi:hypothetical protein
MTAVSLLSQLLDTARRGLARLGGDAARPIVVGATGGSGTRAVHGALARAGAFMGRELNHAGDAMAFEPLLDTYINRVLENTQGLDYRAADLPEGLRAALLEELAEVVARYRADRPERAPAWGWKNPRSMYLLPLIAEVCPGLRFIHLVRDGRDMALSDNQNQLNKHFAALFGAAPGTDGEPAPVASIRLWARVNLDVARWGERRLGRRYVRLRFEDLCARPDAEMGALLARFGLSPDGAAAVVKPDSIGRWREADPALIGRLDAAGGDGLRTFGYL